MHWSHEHELRPVSPGWQHSTGWTKNRLRLSSPNSFRILGERFLLGGPFETAGGAHERSPTSSTSHGVTADAYRAENQGWNTMRLNHIYFAGKVYRIGQAREVGDKSVTEIRLRQSYPKGRKKSGNQELKPEDFHTDWATAVCWGLTSDIAQQLEVDDFIIVEGRWHHEEWTDKKSGDKRQRDVIMTTYLHREPRTFGDVTPSIKISQEEEAFPF